MTKDDVTAYAIGDAVIKYLCDRCTSAEHEGCFGCMALYANDAAMWLEKQRQRTAREREDDQNTITA